MGITRVVTVRHDGARSWKLAAIHIIHTGTLHDVVRSVVLFILAVSFTWPDHGIAGNPGYFTSTDLAMG